ncbi:leucine-rich repeat-containing protein 72 isoform X2 [Danio rerio]|uniref:Leucine-rich repeat-containing protein 72 isoform X2 n=2 Tax=Danio rerio TaxID=7955 RepID=A0AC58HDC8_DANRE
MNIILCYDYQSNKSDACLLETGQTRRSDMESNRQENLVSKCVIIHCDTDVTHLHLAKRGLTSVPDLSRFCMLRCVWLNDNKILEVTRAPFNCCLTELYLQNNDILSISGALRHLTCLRVLLLFNNQIKCLEETVVELKNMQELHTLSLYLNPFTEDPEYRLYVLHHLQSVQFLDTKEVQQVERRRALKLFNAERQKVLDTIAFGRRALPPPIGRKQTNALTKPVNMSQGRVQTVDLIYKTAQRPSPSHSSPL